MYDCGHNQDHFEYVASSVRWGPLFMQFIPVKSRKDTIYTLVDDSHYPYLSKFKWHPTGGYAATKINHKTVYMHRMVLEVGKGVLVDHENQIKLDNRISNLRPADKRRNSLNTRVYKTNSTGFRGVTFDKRRNKYLAQAHKDGQHYFFGYFKTKIEAAYARDAAAINLWGEDALLNFPR